MKLVDVFFSYKVYSEELEAVAQRFADQCVFDHSSRQERNSLSPSFVQVGENIYVGAGIPVNYTDIIAILWSSEEADDYDYESNSCRRECGHYTQVGGCDT